MIYLQTQIYSSAYFFFYYITISKKYQEYVCTLFWIQPQSLIESQKNWFTEEWNTTATLRHKSILFLFGLELFSLLTGNTVWFQKWTFNRVLLSVVESLRLARADSKSSISCWICPLILTWLTTRSSCQPCWPRAPQELHSSCLTLTSQIGPSKYLGEVRYPNHNI